MSARVLPIKEMKELDKLLPPTRQIQSVVLSYDPQWLAFAQGPQSPLPLAWSFLIWASHACQSAWQHFYLAYHDRLYYSKYKNPPEQFSGDAQAVTFFTSFTLHALTAENHLALALLVADGKTFEKTHAPTTRGVLNRLQDQKMKDFLDSLLQKGTDWQFVRDFRNRWVHLDPMRIKELGLQWMESCDRSFWEHDPIQETMRFNIGGADPYEITVNEMLNNGQKGFEIFARQFALAVLYLQDLVRKDWQKWAPIGKAFNLKKPRKRTIPWLRKKVAEGRGKHLAMPNHEVLGRSK